MSKTKKTDDRIAIMVALRPDVALELEAARRKTSYPSKGALVAEVLRVWLGEYMGRNLPDEAPKPEPTPAPKPKPKPAAVPVGRLLDLPTDAEVEAREQATVEVQAAQAAMLERLVSGPDGFNRVAGELVGAAFGTAPQSRATGPRIDETAEEAPEDWAGTEPGVCAECWAESATVPCDDCKREICEECTEVDADQPGRVLCPDCAVRAREAARIAEQAAPPARVRVSIPPKVGTFKSWARLVEAVDPSKSNGYAYTGEWLTRGATVELPVGAVVLLCDWNGRSYQDVSPANSTVDAATVKPDGSYTVFSTGRGRDWAVQILEDVLDAMAGA